MAGERPKGWKLLRAALSTRKAAIMLAFGFSSGLPFALLIGTLNAWLGDAKIVTHVSSTYAVPQYRAIRPYAQFARRLPSRPWFQ